MGLRLTDEATGCKLDLATVRLSAFRGTSAQATLVNAEQMAKTDRLDQLHLVMQAEHVFIPLPEAPLLEQQCTVTASLSRSCTAAAASAAARLADTQAVEVAEYLQELPTVPPFLKPSYPATWSIDNATGGAWQAGGYGNEGYFLS